MMYAKPVRRWYVNWTVRIISKGGIVQNPCADTSFLNLVIDNLKIFPDHV